MLQQILSNCQFDTSGIKKLYIGSTLTDGSTITYPITYETVSGTSDAVISVQFNTSTLTVTIGGQDVVVNEIINTGENITYEETLTIDSNGKNYVKSLNFTIPAVSLNIINRVKQFTMSSDGLAALAPTIAFLVDNNDNYLVIGYDKFLVLQTTEIVIGEDNQISLSYISRSRSRSRSFQIV